MQFSDNTKSEFLHSLHTYHCLHLPNKYRQLRSLIPVGNFLPFLLCRHLKYARVFKTKYIILLCWDFSLLILSSPTRAAYKRMPSICWYSQRAHVTPSAHDWKPSSSRLRTGNHTDDRKPGINKRPKLSLFHRSVEQEKVKASTHQGSFPLSSTVFFLPWHLTSNIKIPI